MQEIIRYFMEECIKNLEDVQVDFYKNPETLAEFVLNTRKETDEIARRFLQMVLQEMDQQIKNLPARKQNWIVEHKSDGKGLITSLGKITINKTLYTSKNEVDENGKPIQCYLLDKVLKLAPNQEMTEDVMANIYEEAVQTSYRKAGELATIDGGVSKGTVKTLLHKTMFPSNFQIPMVKRAVENIYIDADEDHYHLQFQETKGDIITSESGRKLNGAITKLIYVFEGIEPVAPKSNRHRLINAHYFCRGNDQDNKELWKEVFAYIEAVYDMDAIRHVYINSDGGAWIKSGYQGLMNATFVLDGFHLSKYIAKMIAHMKDSQLDAKEELYDAIKNGNKKDFNKIKERLKNCTESEDIQMKIDDAAAYILSNWMAAKYRLQKQEGIVSCSAEGHVYHVLSSRMSTQAMGWSHHGANQMARLREYYYNGGKMMELAKYQREPLKLSAGAEDVVLSANEVLSLKQKTRTEKEYGKYMETMRASMSIHTHKVLMFQLRGKI